jgi:integrase
MPCWWWRNRYTWPQSDWAPTYGIGSIKWADDQRREGPSPTIRQDVRPEPCHLVDQLLKRGPVTSTVVHSETVLRTFYDSHIETGAGPLGPGPGLSRAHRMSERANAALGSDWTLHDLRHAGTRRMAADRDLPLTHVQAVLGHARLATTQRYLVPDQDEVVEKVLAHHARRARRPAKPAPPAGGV